MGGLDRLSSVSFGRNAIVGSSPWRWRKSSPAKRRSRKVVKGEPPALGTRMVTSTIITCCQVFGVARVTVVVSLDWVRRVVGVDWDDWVKVTVEAVVVSAGVPGGKSELMNSVGESVVGEERRVLSRTEAVLRDDCGVPSLMEGIAPELRALGGFCPAVFGARLEAEARVVPREVTWVLVEDHISVSVRGDLDLLEWVGCVLGGGGLVRRQCP